MVRDQQEAQLRDMATELSRIKGTNFTIWLDTINSERRKDGYAPKLDLPLAFAFAHRAFAAALIFARTAALDRRSFFFAALPLLPARCFAHLPF